MPTTQQTSAGFPAHHRDVAYSANGRSIDDIVSAPSRRGGPTADEIVAALKGIYAARRIEAVTA